MGSIIDIVRKISTVMELYGDKVFKVLAPGCADIFAVMFGIWFVWQLIWKGLLNGELVLPQFIKNIFLCTTIILLLQANFYFEWLYKPLSSLSSNFIQEIIKIISPEIRSHETTMFGVLKAQYDALDHVFGMLNKMMQDSSFIINLNQIASILMHLPFTFIYLMMICYCLNYMFNLMIVTALSPLLIIFAGFKNTRPTTINAFRLLLHGTLTLAASVLAMGLSLYALKETVHLIPLTAEGAVREGGTSFAFSKEYWMCFIIAGMTIYFQLLCPKVANISGFTDGPGAAAFVSGFIATSMAAAKFYTGKLGGWAGRKAFNASKGASGWAYNKLTGHKPSSTAFSESAQKSLTNIASD